MLTGDDLSTQYFVGAAAIAVLGIGMTQAGWTHKWFVRGLFALGIVLALVALLWRPIIEMFPRVSEITNPIGSTPSAWLALFMIGFGAAFWLDYRSRTAPKAASFEAIDKEIEQIKGRLSTVEGTGGTTRDVLLLMHFVIYQSTMLMLDDLLSAAPKDMALEPLQLGGDFVLKNALAKEFVDLVRRKLDHNSQRRSDFESFMYNAEVTAERRLEETPVAQRPKGVDALALRRWVIAHMQCVCAIEFLEQQKKEAARNLLNQRSNLLEQYRLRNSN